jgi:hypothetical protein
MPIPMPTPLNRQSSGGESSEVRHDRVSDRGIRNWRTDGPQGMSLEIPRNGRDPKEGKTRIVLDKIPRKERIRLGSPARSTSSMQ